MKQNNNLQQNNNLNLPTKKELEEIMKIRGRIKGFALKVHADYILAKKGTRGLRDVERKTEELGFPIQYEKVGEADWYPIGLSTVSLVAMFNTFNWGKKEFIEYSQSVPKISYIIRVFLKFFPSSEKVFRIGVSTLWKRYFDFGEAEPVDFKEDSNGGYSIVRIKNFKVHSVWCLFLGHFFIGVGRLVVPGVKNFTIKETKCMFKGDPYHEYLMKWTFK